MLKYAKYAVPLFMKAPQKNPVKRLVKYALAYLLIALSGIFFFVAAFIWLAKTYGTETAFAATGGAMFLIALLIILFSREPSAKAVSIPASLANDPLAQYIPDNIKDNPTVQKLLYQIADSPVTATATAVTVGMLLSKEIFEEK
ncbi:hypothetical protein ACJ3XI_08565 [Litorimonas sp. RW-G-Af-16]|uniref:hypothetical protein n=1 Tax=Litorimonas sp. RW-G-Af-16 TaxID=3241168 RepID=UPI00390C8043